MEAELKRRLWELFPYCGGFAVSAFLKTLTAPLERYRLIRQTQDILTLQEKEKMRNLFSYFQKQSVRSHWNGNLTSIYLWFPQIFSSVVFLQNIKQSVYSEDVLSRCLSASLCGVTTLFFAYPFDTIRIRQATELVQQPQRLYTSFSETRFQISIESGLRGLYSGFSIAALHAVLLGTTVVGALKLLEDQAVPYQEHLAYAGSFALLYPLESIRHRLQVRSILFQQEAAKQTNIVQKLSSNLRDWRWGWGYGGFLAHNFRFCWILVMNAAIENEWKKLRIE